MTNIAMDMIKAYIDTFDEYDIKDSSLKEELENLKGKMTSFARANNDPLTFYGKFAESGLQEEYTNLIGKVAMAALSHERSDQASSSDEDPLDISVKDFLDQYRSPYEEVKKSGDRKNGEKAYENLFAVADRANKMLDAQIIIEEERLLWHIVKDDQLDILRASLGKLDPLQDALTVSLEKQIELTEKAQAIEELDYLLEEFEYEKIRLVNHAVTKMTLVIHITTQLLAYSNSKLNVQLLGGEGEKGEKALKVMLGARASLKGMFKLMERDFKWTFDDLLKDEGLKIWMLKPKNIEETGRIKEALNPRNYQALRELVYEEILSDKTIIEVLKRKVETPIFYEI